MLDQIWKVIVFIVGTVVVVFAAYYVTYYIGKKSLVSAAGRSIRLRDRLSVSKDKSFCLVEVKGKVYIVAMTNHSATLLDTLSAEQFAEEDEARAASSPFAAGAVQKGIVKGFSYVRDNWVRRDSSEQKTPESEVSLRMAEEEDSLDLMYREMQARRAGRRSNSSREDGE